MHDDSLDESTLQVGSATGRRALGRFDAAQSVLALTVLFHPSRERIGDRALLPALGRGEPVALSRREPRFISTDRHRELALRDRHLSRKPWWIRPTEHGVEIESSGSASALRVAGDIARGVILISRERLADGVVLELCDRIVLLLHHHRLALAAEPPKFGLVGESSAMIQVRGDIERVADLDVPVLIRGETGTGKELVANAVHKASGRLGRCLAVNLAAIPESLATAELFGAKKGAFTGAAQTQPGYFARADGGTLFLDEVGEAPLELQAQLLRVLETREIQPLGEQKPRRVNVRLVAATDADLESKIANGSFRSPLLHRLAGYEIRLPPLHARRDDFGRLLLHFLSLELEAVGQAKRLEAAELTDWLDAGLVARLASLDWPGNVRQLRNVVRQQVIGSRHAERLLVTAPIERLFSEQPPRARESSEAPTRRPISEPQRPHRRKPATVTEQELRVVLREQRWNLKTTSEVLGISRTSLYALIDKFQSVRAPADIRSDEIRRAFDDCGGNLEAMAEQLEVSVRTLRRRVRELGLIA